MRDELDRETNAQGAAFDAALDDPSYPESGLTTVTPPAMREQTAIAGEATSDERPAAGRGEASSKVTWVHRFCDDPLWLALRRVELHVP